MCDTLSLLEAQNLNTIFSPITPVLQRVCVYYLVVFPLSSVDFPI